MDTRLEVEEVAGEEQARRPPVEPQGITGERHDQRPHPKREPAGGGEAPHAGIHERIARAARLPGVEPLGADLVFAEAVGRPEHVVKLDRRFILELLHEVAVPVEPGLHPLHAPLPGLEAGTVARARSREQARLHLSPAGLALLPDGPHRDRAERQIRTQPRATRRRRQRARDAAGVVPPAARQEVVEHVARRTLATALAVLRVCGIP